MRRSAILILLLAGCAAPRTTPIADLLRKLETRERVEAFQQLLAAPPDAVRALKPFAAVAPHHGCPVAAVLYRLGEGDSVPLDVKARHFALFEWPSQYREENVILEAIITRRLRHDLIRAGRAAIPHLAAAFDDSPRAGDVARLMLFLDERAAAAEFAKRIDHSEARKALTRVAGTDALKGWWEKHRNLDPDEWIRSRCRALLQSDLTGFNRETGARFKDHDTATVWWRQNQARRPVEWWAAYYPKAGPANLSPLYEALPDSSARKLLESWTGVRLDGPQTETRWRRSVESPLLRLRLAIFAGDGKPWAQVRVFPAAESLQAGGSRLMNRFDYLLSLFVDREGTRILVGEYASDNDGTRGKTWDIHPKSDLVYFHSDLIDAWVVMTLDEVPRRPPPETPASTQAAVIRVIEASKDLDAKRILEK